MESDPANLDRPWPFIRRMVAVEEVDSTSDRAAELARAGGVPLPLCVWARRQTRGRGRGAHTWWSDSGSLTFTLALDPEAHGLARPAEPKLALATAVAVIDALIAGGFASPALGIRWPNDVEVDGRKLGGILPEPIETAHGRRILIGVGINVSTDDSAMPAEIRGMAASLSTMTGRPVEPELLPTLLASILDQFGSVLARLGADDPALVRRWNDLDLLRDEWVRMDVGPRILGGWGRGIEADGSLCIDDGHKRHRLIGGQVLR